MCLSDESKLPKLEDANNLLFLSRDFRDFVEIEKLRLLEVFLCAVFVFTGIFIFFLVNLLIHFKVSLNRMMIYWIS